MIPPSEMFLQTFNISHNKNNAKQKSVTSIYPTIYPTIGKYSEVQQKKFYTIWRQIELVIVAFVILGLVISTYD